MTPDANPIRIVIADDHAVVNEGLKRVLESRPGFRVIGQAADGVEAVRLATQLQPDVLLLDLVMPNAGGIDVLQALARGIPLPVIILTGGIDRDALVDAIRLGARGVVLKECGAAVLFDSIRCVMDGHYWLDRQNVVDIVQALRCFGQQADAGEKRNRFGLTKRELQVVAAAASGESNKEIARRLNVSEQTVKHHLSNIFDKTGVFSRVELAVFAMNHGLADAPVS